MPKQTFTVEMNPGAAACTLTDLLAIAIDLNDLESLPEVKQQITSVLYAARYIAEALEERSEHTFPKLSTSVGPKPDYSKVKDISYAPLPYTTATGEHGFHRVSPPRNLSWGDACDAGRDLAAHVAILLSHQPADFSEALKNIAGRLSHDATEPLTAFDDERAEANSARGFSVGFYWFMSEYIARAAAVVDPWAVYAELYAECEEAKANDDGGAA